MMPPSSFQTTNLPVQPVNISSVFGMPPGNVSETRNSETNEPTTVRNNSNVADGAKAQVEDADNEEADKKGKDDNDGELV